MNGIIRRAGVVLIGLMLWYHSGCIDPYKIQITSAKSYLIVEGEVSNLPDKQVITLWRTKTNSVYKSSEFTSTIVAQKGGAEPVKGAKVKVIENEKISYNLTEEVPGQYALPLSFVGKVGSTYQLSIQLSEGTQYQSAVETLLPVAPIKRVYDTFNPKGILDRTTSVGQLPTHDFYVDFDDPAQERNFYRWTATTYEIQDICATCRGGRYARGNTADAGGCNEDRSLSVNNLFDYRCEAYCWDVFYGSTLEIFSDVYTDGKSQKDKFVTQVPLYQSNPCLVVIRQLSLSANAYRYLKLIQDQSVNTGTLADTPPAPIKGNIENIADKAELVLGYFMASMVDEKRYWLLRTNAPNAQPYGLFAIKNGRDPILEPSSVDRPNIPMASCVTAGTRTSNAPSGWRF